MTRRRVLPEGASSEAYVLLYDADCGFCRWAVGRVLRWDRGGQVRPCALQDPEATRWLAGLPQEVRMASWHLVDPQGRVASGGRAVAPLLRLLPFGAPLAALAHAFPGMVDAAYRWVARHRSKLGRLVRGSSCRPER
ncbi:MAG: thiol-disulfide oxidoreductase DCC family protein [bacterium]